MWQVLVNILNTLGRKNTMIRNDEYDVLLRSKSTLVEEPSGTERYMIYLIYILLHSACNIMNSIRIKIIEIIKKNSRHPPPARKRIGISYYTVINPFIDIMATHAAPIPLTTLSKNK